jgi:heterogeneous nuclear ribonucleoprotein F/H
VNNKFLPFVSDCNVIGGKSGIHFTYDRDGRPSGEAYIELGTEEDLQKALSKDKANMGKRYIEGNFTIIRQSLTYMSRFIDYFNDK